MKYIIAPRPSDSAPSPDNKKAPFRVLPIHINKKEVTLNHLHLSPTVDWGHFRTLLLSNIISNPLFLQIQMLLSDTYICLLTHFPGVSMRRSILGSSLKFSHLFLFPELYSIIEFLKFTLGFFLSVSFWTSSLWLQYTTLWAVSQVGRFHESAYLFLSETQIRSHHAHYQLALTAVLW